MSKHPTSELSPRDIAAMDYGHQYMKVINAFRQRNFVPRCYRYYRGFVRDEIKVARRSRAYIFRKCSDCVYGEDWASFCLCKNKEIGYGGKISHEKACTCPHFKARES